MAGRPARASAAFVVATCRAWAARSVPERLRCRTEAVAAAATGGGRAVVKMKPGAWLRTASTTAAEAAM